MRVSSIWGLLASLDLFFGIFCFLRLCLYCFVKVIAVCLAMRTRVDNGFDFSEFIRADFAGSVFLFGLVHSITAFYLIIARFMWFCKFLLRHTFVLFRCYNIKRQNNIDRTRFAFYNEYRWYYGKNRTYLIDFSAGTSRRKTDRIGAVKRIWDFNEKRNARHKWNTRVFGG